MQRKEVPGTFYEMLRSFVTLAETLNVSKTMQILSTTRQTIKRHVSDLQIITGQEFFDRSTHQYKLTKDGATALTGAKLLLLQCDNWLERKPDTHDEFVRNALLGREAYFVAQSHPIIDVWNLAPNMLRLGLKSWIDANGELEHPAMNRIRPYLLICREHDQGWLFADIGERSAFASWYGEDWWNSLVGTYLESLPVIFKSHRQNNDAYHYAAVTGGICYEHICERRPYPKTNELENVNHQRLIFPCMLPDNSKVLASLVFRTNDVQISGIEPNLLPRMADELLMQDIDL